MNELEELLAIEEQLTKTKATVIKDDIALITKGTDELIFPQTINVIQGSEGSHKSRLASMIVSCVLKQTGCSSKILDLDCSRDEMAIIYVDTERNLKSQFPRALQQMQTVAGFQITDQPDSFFYTSLYNVPRKKRMKSLGKFIYKKKNENLKKHFLIVLDVLTDCLSNFNDPNQSMSLIDNLNKLINQHECTILGVIHVNPGSEKARGHIGTEIANKASTVIQTKVLRDAGSEVIQISFKKCRNTKCYDPFYATFDPIEGLQLADSTTGVTRGIINKAITKSKAPPEQVIKELERLLVKPMESNVVKKSLCDTFGCSLRTIEDSIKFIYENGKLILKGGLGCCLKKKRKAGKTIFFLTPLVYSSEEE